MFSTELEPGHGSSGHRATGSVIMSGSGRVSGQSYFRTDPVSWPGFWQNNGMIQRLFICWQHTNALCKVGAQCVRWRSLTGGS